ncbi:hypothetical protein [Kribbella sp. NPDC006257]|uniref:hypothetical protein n=1 Tax=Kribbella sp. NPDC006257 TaxID=3156738 RepID=UPI00339F00D7
MTTTTATPKPANLRPVGAFLAIVLMLLLAMNELSLLSAGFQPLRGPSGPFGTHWHSILGTAQLPHWQELLRDFLALDYLFIVTYTTALYCVVRCRSRAWYAVFVLPLLDVAENVVTGHLGAIRCADSDCISGTWTGLLTGLTALKWAAFGVLVLVAVGLLLGARARPLRRLFRALYLQRFSLLAFLPIAALAVVPGSNVLDQIPDVQRRWLGDVTGLGQAALAGVVYLVILLPAIFVLGRLRSDWALRRVRGEEDGWPFYDQPDEPGGKPKERRYNPLPWLIGPALLVVTAVVIQLANGGTVFWLRLAIFCAIPVLVVGLSRWQRDKEGRKPRKLRDVYPEFPKDVMATGDAIAVASLSLAGLGMIRAYSGLTALDFVDLVDRPHFPPLIALLVGAVLAVGPWLVVGRLLRMIERWDAEEEGRRGWIGRFLTPGENIAADGQIRIEPQTTWRWTLLVVSIVAFGVLAIMPRQLGSLFGVLAATILAMTALVTMLGVLVVFMQDRQPPEIFQVGCERLRTRSTPIITLLLIALILTGVAGGKTDIHSVAADGTVPPRPTLDEAFTGWLGQKQACGIPVTMTPEQAAAGKKLTVRPMLMLAAEGGGIRAAYWTAATLSKIGAAGAGCGGHSALMSAGASGGALGLALGRFTKDPLDSAHKIAGHEALSAVTISLLTADLLASTAGLRFAGRDRAGLMEATWEEKLDGVGTSFLAGDKATALTGADVVTGQLVLNSTAVRDGCLALLSQVDLTTGARSADGSPLCGTEGTGPHSYDFFGAYGRASGEGADECVGNLRALTGTMLANRFPYVSPSGTAEGCRGLDPVQLVDGGYTDNTGLGTLFDLSPQWNKLVQKHNDEVVAAGTGEFVVPVVVYIENGTGPDFSAARDETPRYDSRVTPGTGSEWPNNLVLVPEGVVPLVTKFVTAKGDQTKSPEMLSELGRKLTPASLCTSSTLCNQLAAQVPNTLIVVHQSKEPSLSAPLGWVLSETSQNHLNDDLTTQAGAGCSDPTCGYSTLADLVNILKPPS